MAGEASSGSMLSFPDTSIIATTMPGAPAANPIIEGLQNEISPGRIARRISDMLEATSIGPTGAECPDWRTIEAGVKLYLACVRPVATDSFSLAAQTGSRASNGVASLSVSRNAAPAGPVREEQAGSPAQQQPVARELPRSQPEPLEFMRRMMVAEPGVMTSRRDADRRPVPRRSRAQSTPAASEAAGHQPAVGKTRNPGEFNLVIFRKSRWLAMLAGCFAVVWVAGNSLREPVSAQPGQQPVSPPRLASPAGAVRQPQNGELKSWFLEDLQAEFSSGVARGSLLE